MLVKVRRRTANFYVLLVIFVSAVTARIYSVPPREQVKNVFGSKYLQRRQSFDYNDFGNSIEDDFVSDALHKVYPEYIPDRVTKPPPKLIKSNFGSYNND